MSSEEEGWVSGFEFDGKEYRAWVNDAEAPPHRWKWDEALQVALDKKTEHWDVGQEGEFTLTYRVRVSKTNPGWVDGYKVDPGG